jgi:hypothetical protein
MKQSDIENIQRVLMTESPWNYGVMDDDFENQMSNFPVEKALQMDLTTKWNGCDIYHKSEFGYGEFYIVKNNEVVAFYRFDPKGDYIQTKLTWNKRKNKGILRKFLAEYIIPRYNTVESGNKLSTNAFDMWETMFLEYPQYEYLVKYQNGEIKKITHHTQFILYSSSTLNNELSFITFVVKGK